jgi:hypothetical protein
MALNPGLTIAVSVTLAFFAAPASAADTLLSRSDAPTDTMAASSQTPNGTTELNLLVYPVSQAIDAEKPRAMPAAPLDSPKVASLPPRAADPSEPGLIAGESAVAYLTASLTAGVGLLVGLTQGTGGLVLVGLAGPAATGGVVCAVGSGSNSFDGDCRYAIGGAYLGGLVAIPMAVLAHASAASSSSDRLLSTWLAGILGYAIGSTVGAVVGWNVSRTPKNDRSENVAALDALAAARAVPWTEPISSRSASPEITGPRLEVPVLSFRF